MNVIISLRGRSTRCRVAPTQASTRDWKLAPSSSGVGHRMRWVTACQLLLVSYSLIEIIKSAYDASISCRASSCWVDDYCYVEVPVVTGESSGARFAVHRHEQIHGVGILDKVSTNETESFCSVNGGGSMNQFRVMLNNQTCLLLSVGAVAIGGGLSLFALLQENCTCSNKSCTIGDLIKAKSQGKKAPCCSDARWNVAYRAVATLCVFLGAAYGLYFGVHSAGRDLWAYLQIIAYPMFTAVYEIWATQVLSVDESTIIVTGELPDYIMKSTAKEVIEQMQAHHKPKSCWESKLKPTLAEMVAFLLQHEICRPVSNSSVAIEMTTAPVISMDEEEEQTDGMDRKTEAMLGHALPSSDAREQADTRI